MIPENNTSDTITSTKVPNQNHFKWIFSLILLTIAIALGLTYYYLRPIEPQTTTVVNSALSREDAIGKVKQLPEVKEWEKLLAKSTTSKAVFEVVRLENDKYVIHVVEEFETRAVTFNWYEVDKNTGKVTGQFDTQSAGENLEKLGIKMNDVYAEARKTIIKAGWIPGDYPHPVDPNFPEIVCDSESTSNDPVCSAEFSKIYNESLIFYVTGKGGTWRVSGEI